MKPTDWVFLIGEVNEQRDKIATRMRNCLSGYDNKAYSDFGSLMTLLKEGEYSFELTTIFTVDGWEAEHQSYRGMAAPHAREIEARWKKVLSIRFDELYDKKEPNQGIKIMAKFVLD